MLWMRLGPRALTRMLEPRMVWRLARWLARRLGLVTDSYCIAGIAGSGLP